MDLQPGIILDNKYRIIKKLGQGGMGAVYLAHDDNLDMDVALKVNRNAAPEAAAQFLREGRILASLRHIRLPIVRNSFVKDDEQYLVMDYIPGEDLAARLQKEGRQPLDRVMPWITQMGEALEYLHSHKPPVIHRDIKPANIKLSEKGEAVLVDFGIAKASEATQATATGAGGYTPGYAPPEQFGGTGTGPYTDQFSLAATMYALLTGQKPIDSVQRMMGKGDLTPPRKINSSIPDHVEQALLKAMSIKPDDRYRSVTDFIQALKKPADRREMSADDSATVVDGVGVGRQEDLTAMDLDVQRERKIDLDKRSSYEKAEKKPAKKGSVWLFVLGLGGMLFLGILVLGFGSLLVSVFSETPTPGKEQAASLTALAANKNLTPSTKKRITDTPTFSPLINKNPTDEKPAAEDTATPTNTKTPLPTETETTVPTEVKNILFSDDFSNSNSGWGTRDDEYGLVTFNPHGGLDFTFRTADQMIWSNPQLDFTDASIEVDVTKFSGLDTNDMGVICRYNTEKKSLYYFAITTEGSFAVHKLENGEWTYYGDQQWTEASEIKTGNAMNHLRADCVGNTLAFYINGQRVFSTLDDTFSSGDIALGATSYNEAGLEVRFNNLSVYQP